MLRPGDVVRLKSGGPKMTVHRLIGDSPNSAFGVGLADEYFIKIKGCRNGDPVCQWFEGADLKSDVFRAEALQNLDETQPP